MSQPNDIRESDPEAASDWSTKRRRFMAGLGTALGASALGGNANAQTFGRGKASGRRRNLVLLIPDGSSMAHDTAARYYRAWEEDSEAFPMNVGDVELGVDRADDVGYMSTHPDDPTNTVTDSAAAGTAIATGQKTYSGAISVDADGRPLETILEKAADAGYATGLVTTSQLTHATPPTFAAHVENRGNLEEIARQYVQEADVDVLLGGDRSHFRADEREDGHDLIGEAEDDGYAYVETASELDDVEDGKVLGLFNESGHMDYYLDRHHAEDTTQPGLPEMAEKAIELLEARSRKGFFLMVESARIDHAAHGNDPAAIPEQVEHDETVDLAMGYAEDEPRFGRGRSDTLVVNVADHETGGLVLGRDSYEQNWDPIVGMEASQAVLEREIGDLDSVTAVKSYVEERVGIDDLSTDEATDLYDDPSLITGADGLINERAQIDWATGNHSAVDVPIYAKGPLSEHLAGKIDNTDLLDVFGAHLRVR